MISDFAEQNNMSGILAKVNRNFLDASISLSYTFSIDRCNDESTI